MKFTTVLAAAPLLSTVFSAPAPAAGKSGASDLTPLVYVKNDGSLWVGPEGKVQLTSPEDFTTSTRSLTKRGCCNRRGSRRGRKHRGGCCSGDSCNDSCEDPCEVENPCEEVEDSCDDPCYDPCEDSCDDDDGCCCSGDGCCCGGNGGCCCGGGDGCCGKAICGTAGYSCNIANRWARVLADCIGLICPHTYCPSNNCNYTGEEECDPCYDPCEDDSGCCSSGCCC